MQGISLGPADLAADRRMKTTRVGGGHPGYLVRQDPVGGDITGSRATYQQDLWHYTIARMVDACAMHGIFPYYGPFGDIADVVACEDQFRNAFLLGCVGTWTLHPAQIAIAKKVFSPQRRRRRARPAGRGGHGRRHRRRDARRQDGGRRQPQAVPRHPRARRAAVGQRPRARRAVCRRRRPAVRRRARERRHGVPAAPLGALHAEQQRAGAREGEVPAGRRADPRPRGCRGSGPQGSGARERLRGSGIRRATARER